MKTLNSIDKMKEKYGTFYKIQCPECGEYLVIPQQELEFNEEDVEEKEYTQSVGKMVDGKLVMEDEKVKAMLPKDRETVRYKIRCCNCGSIFNVKQKDTYACLCDSFGDTNYSIEFTDKMTEQRKDFMKKHKNCSQKKLNRPFFTALGQQYTYTITPGGLGNCVSIKCNVCGETEDLTDVDSW